MSSQVTRTTVQTPQQSQLENKPKATHKGRSYWEITKLVAKIIGGVALGSFGMVCVAGLVVGILLMVNPFGFGIGNLLGMGLAWTGMAIGGLVGKAVAILAGEAMLITVLSAIGLGATGAVAAGITVASICESRSRKKVEMSDSTNPSPAGSRITKNPSGSETSSDEEEEDFSLEEEIPSRRTPVDVEVPVT
jgi:hypothetical protein